MKQVIYVILSLSGVVLINSCSKNDSLTAEKELTLSNFKTLLVNKNTATNPIVRIDKVSNPLTVSFEDGSQIAVNQSMIAHIDNDSIHWSATFSFTDNTHITAYTLGKLHIDTSAITVNPYGVNPLTALANIHTPIKGQFKIIVHGKGTKGVTISKSFNTYDTLQVLPILGLYQNYDNQVEFVFTNRSGAARASTTVSVVTQPIPVQPNIAINTNNLGTDYNGIYFISSLHLAFDQAGEVRWCYTPASNPHLSFMRKLANGNMIAVSPDGYSFTEQTMVGQSLKTYPVPGGIHHDIIELPTGNFLVTSSTNNGVSAEDLIVEIDRSSGALTKSWDIFTTLDPSRKPLPDSGGPTDWLHMNSLYFDTSDQSILFSSRTQSSVVKIDYATGAIKWILGNPNFWSTSFSSYLLTPVDANGNPLDVSGKDFWEYGQHAVSRLQNGNIFMYDDGDYRNYYDDQSVPKASYSRAVEYAINEQAKTIKLVWEFDYNKSQFTPYTGFVQQLSNSNRIIAYMGGAFAGGTGPKIVEIDNNNQVQFDADVNKGAFYYRGAKIDLYQGMQ